MANHILVVDDDPSICEALERGFRLEGFAVRIATNGEVQRILSAYEQHCEKLRCEENNSLGTAIFDKDADKLDEDIPKGALVFLALVFLAFVFLALALS